MKKNLMDETSELTKLFQKVSDQLELEDSEEETEVDLTEVEIEEVLGHDNS
jgi:hypothetical protein